MDQRIIIERCDEGYVGHEQYKSFLRRCVAFKSHHKQEKQMRRFKRKLEERVFRVSELLKQ